ncbi:MAG: hypothetical protein CML47_07040 [Rhodobacteraceae bacterium]|nr:MAG: hypothetical protein CML47_07040 [Paracoccaceae bacterium]
MTKPIFDYKYARELCDTKKCELDETEESMNSLLKGVNRRSDVKINIICQCKHKRTLRFKELQDNTNKYPHYPIKCKECCKLISNDKRKKSNGKGETYKQNDNVIEYIQNLLSNDFDFDKLEEGNNISAIIKPKTKNNNWVKLRISITNIEDDIVSKFPFTRCIYKDTILICYDNYKKLIYVIPQNIFDKKSLQIRPFGISKYNIYKVDENKLNERLIELYETTTHFNKEDCVEPTCIDAKLEYMYRIIREKKISYLKFDRLDRKSADFKIGNINIQEKTDNPDSDKNYPIEKYKQFRYQFEISHHIKGNRVAYEKDENEFYWFNLAKTRTFYVIPATDKHMLKNNKIIRHLTFYSEKPPIRYKHFWTEKYKFNYDTINEENEKSRILNLLGINQENT